MLNNEIIVENPDGWLDWVVLCQWSECLLRISQAASEASNDDEHAFKEIACDDDDDDWFFWFIRVLVAIASSTEIDWLTTVLTQSTRPAALRFRRFCHKRRVLGWCACIRSLILTQHRTHTSQIMPPAQNGPWSRSVRPTTSHLHKTSISINQLGNFVNQSYLWCSPSCRGNPLRFAIQIHRKHNMWHTHRDHRATRDTKTRKKQAIFETGTRYQVPVRS